MAAPVSLPRWIRDLVRTMPFGDDRVIGDIGTDTRAGWRADVEDALGGWGTLTGPTRDSPWPSPMHSRFHGGVASLTATTAETTIYGYVNTYTPRLIILSVGLVDIIGGATATTVLDTVDRVIALAFTARPGLGVLWLTPTPVIGAYSAYDSVREEFAEGMPARVLAHRRLGRDVTLVDAGAAITDTATQFATDLNPNAAGYALMGAVISPAVAKWLRGHGYTRDT